MTAEPSEHALVKKARKLSSVAIAALVATVVLFVGAFWPQASSQQQEQTTTTTTTTAASYPCYLRIGPLWIWNPWGTCTGGRSGGGGTFSLQIL